MEDMVMQSVKESRMAKSILSVFVVWSFVLPGILGIGMTLVGSAGDGPIDPSPNMTVTTPLTWYGVARLDENLVITGAGDLTVENGGIIFVQDQSHPHSLTIQAGGRLSLINSFISVETNQLEPYLILPVSVAGTLYGEDAALEFPGFVNVTGGGEIIMWDSLITGLDYVPPYVPGRLGLMYGPIMTITGTGDSQFYRSRIDSMFTTTAWDRNNATLGYWFDFNIGGDARVWIVDTYIGVDYESDVNAHNVLWARDNSRVYAYNLTLDTSHQGTGRQSAIRTSAPIAEVFLMRWARVLCVDNSSIPIENVPLTPVLITTSGPPSFPDTGNPTPHNYILNYVGRTDVTWKRTGPDGIAMLPLPTDEIDWMVDQTAPNSKYDGSYNVSGTYGGYTDSVDFSFPPYPAMDGPDGTYEVTLRFPVDLPKPDLVVTDIIWDPASPSEDDDITFTATVENQGGSAALDVWVRFYVDLQPLSNGTNVGDILVSGSKNPSDTYENCTGGNHSVRVVADFVGMISESDETNNARTEPFTCIPKLPDYEILPGYITFPPASYIGNPVLITVSVTNFGNDTAEANTVAVYNGDPALGNKIGDAPLGEIPPQSTNQTSIYHTFYEPGDYRICAVVDEANTVAEMSEDNNEACNILRVDLAPNLVVTSNDIGIGNPCTRAGEQATPQAKIRNLGYRNAGAFRVDFYIDGVYFASGNSTGILANGSEVVSSTVSWTPPGPGAHILEVDVDADDVVKESTKADNIATKEILIFHSQMAAVYSGAEILNVPATFNGSIDITGSLTIDGVDVEIRQREMFDERFCIKVLGTGSLTLTNGANLFSTYPLVIYVTNSATLTVIDSNVVLDHGIHGKGGLYADSSGMIVMETSSLYGDLFSTGDSVSLKGVDLLGLPTGVGTELYIEAADTSYIWDTQFIEVIDLSLLSDDGNVNTVDFDIRNATFDENLDSQLVFKGDQLVEFTSVETYIPTGEDWWTGMITENAKVRMYHWLTVKMVDGTGSVLLPPVQPSMTLENLDKTILQWQVVPGFPTGVPSGILIHRTLSEEVQVDWSWVNSTYSITATADVGGTLYYPDTEEARGNWTGDVHSDMEVELRFSGLTPDFSVISIAFIGDGIGNDQPVNRPLQINATIYNAGNIASTGVEVCMYLGPQLIGYDNITVPAAGSEFAVDGWTPTSIGFLNILVVADCNNTKREVDENNNDLTAVLRVFGWPDLEIRNSDIIFPTSPVELTPSEVIATVMNNGTISAVEVTVTFSDDDGWTFNRNISSIAQGDSVDVPVLWTPQSAGNHILTVIVHAFNNTLEQTDYDQSDNVASQTVLVLTRPELVLYDLTMAENVTVGTTFPVHLIVNNTGGSDARNVIVQLRLEYDGESDFVDQEEVNISAGSYVELDMTGTPIWAIRDYQMCGYVDPDNQIPEAEPVTNNYMCVDFEVIPPTGYITIEAPEDDSVYDSGDSFIVIGWVEEVGTDRGIQDVDLTIQLEDLDGSPVGSPIYTTSKENGRILRTFTMPDDLPCDGEYRLRVHANETYISEETVNLRTSDCPDVWPLWVWLLILAIIIAVVVAVAVTAYVRVFGLGKLVECGECGAFIPEDSTSCPKCGVEFETETAKCSNCQAWIPLKVKKCPECGVEFATGEVEMEDYKAKMKMQYDEVRARFKQEAEAELGKALSDGEFESWWKTQATFVTFDQWLKQEEDMRKMGSKPCPSCGTLNSVTATICHKCGALLEEEEKPRRPPAKPPGEKPKEAVPAKKVAAPPERVVGKLKEPPAARPAAVKPVAKKTLPTVERPVPKKVIKKPVVEGRPSVVPKKVVKKPEEEEEEEY
jgi:subtilase family serine protease/ribosomal protein L40E